MKILFNKKGIALIILLGAIIFVAALGAGFVSLMGTKHTSFLYQVSSYKSLNISNAGVEYAIRNISDGLSDANSMYYNNLLSNHTGNIDMINFGGGSFTIIRNYSSSNNLDYIEVTGTYPNPTSVIKTRITSFSRYLQSITFISDPSLARKPYLSLPRVYVPIMSNDDTNDISIDTLQIEVFDAAGNKMPYLLKYIYDDAVPSNYLFKFENKKKESEGCPSPADPPPCRADDGVDLSKYNIFPINNFQILKNARIRTISFEFTANPPGKYRVKFFQGGSSGTIKGAIEFTI